MSWKKHTWLGFVDGLGWVCFSIDVKGSFLFRSFCGIDLWD
jgi:hypothetical protein